MAWPQVAKHQDDCKKCDNLVNIRMCKDWRRCSRDCFKPSHWKIAVWIGHQLLNGTEHLMYLQCIDPSSKLGLKCKRFWWSWEPTTYQPIAFAKTPACNWACASMYMCSTFCCWGQVSAWGSRWYVCLHVILRIIHDFCGAHSPNCTLLCPWDVR